MKLTNLHKKVCIYYKRKLLQHISNRNTTTKYYYQEVVCLHFKIDKQTADYETHNTYIPA